MEDGQTCLSQLVDHLAESGWMNWALDCSLDCFHDILFMRPDYYYYFSEFVKQFMCICEFILRLFISIYIYVKRLCGFVK